MRVFDQGAYFRVTVSAREMSEFAARWPCSGMGGARRGLSFAFERRTGDLVDVAGEPGSGDIYDGGAMAALAADAQEYGVRALASRAK